MRIALVAGPGGVGATTVAAVTAVAAAEQGRRTVLLSGDPSVDAVLGNPADDERPAARSPRSTLTVRRPDAQVMVTRAWPAITGYLSALGVDGDLDPAELSSIPAAQPLAVLLEIAAVARSGAADVLVVDAGASAVSLLAAAETLGFLTDLLVPIPLRIIRQVGGLSTHPAGEAEDQPADRLGDLLGELVLAQSVLCDPQFSAVHLVTGPGALRIAAARRMVPLLALYGAGLGRVIVNRLTKRSSAAAGDVAGWAAETVIIPEQSAEPTGGALNALAHSIFGDRDPLAVSAAPALTEARADAVDGGSETFTEQTFTKQTFTMQIPLPLADKAALNLARSDDDLLITVDRRTRRVELPSLLQRCTVTGAAFADDALSVSFEPDPERWPQALAANAAGSSDGAS